MDRVTVHESTRYRIMVGLSTRGDGTTMDPDTARRAALEAADAFLKGYTVFDGLGSWEGVKEKSLVIETLVLDTDGLLVNTMVDATAKTIAAALAQAEVWVTAEPVEVTRFIREDS